MESCSRIGESPRRFAAVSPQPPHAAPSWGGHAVPPRRSLAGVTVQRGIPAAPRRRPTTGCPPAALLHRMAAPLPLPRCAGGVALQGRRLPRRGPGVVWNRGLGCADARPEADAFHAAKSPRARRCSPQPARPTHPLTPPPGQCQQIGAGEPACLPARMRVDANSSPRHHERPSRTHLLPEEGRGLGQRTTSLERACFPLRFRKVMLCQQRSPPWPFSHPYRSPGASPSREAPRSERWPGEAHSVGASRREWRGSWNRGKLSFPDGASPTFSGRPRDRHGLWGGCRLRDRQGRRVAGAETRKSSTGHCWRIYGRCVWIRSSRE
jgi:hypothetical protein